MVVRFVLWNLADSGTSIAELREHVAPSRGAVAETWFSDEATERFGAFTIFDDVDAAGELLPAVLRELATKEPDVVELFDLESRS